MLRGRALKQRFLSKLNKRTLLRLAALLVPMILLNLMFQNCGKNFEVADSTQFSSLQLTPDVAIWNSGSGSNNLIENDKMTIEARTSTPPSENIELEWELAESDLNSGEIPQASMKSHSFGSGVVKRGQFVWPKGKTTFKAEIGTISTADGVYSGNKKYRLSVVDPSKKLFAEEKTVIVTIKDSDPAPQFVVNNFIVNEGETSNIEIKLNGKSSVPQAVALRPLNSLADYYIAARIVPRVIVLQPFEQQKTISITVPEDQFHYSVQTAEFDLQAIEGSVQNATLRLTISDSSAPPVFTVTAIDSTLGKKLLFPVEYSTQLAERATFEWEIQAEVPGDMEFVQTKSGLVTLQPGIKNHGIEIETLPLEDYYRDKKFRIVFKNTAFVSPAPGSSSIPFTMIDSKPHEAPKILKPLASEVLPEGTLQVPLEVKASGIPAPTYQWFVNDVPQGTTTNTFQLTAQPGKTLTVKMRAENLFGAAVTEATYYFPCEVAGQKLIDGVCQYKKEWVLTSSASNYMVLKPGSAAHASGECLHLDTWVNYTNSAGVTTKSYCATSELPERDFVDNASQATKVLGTIVRLIDVASCKPYPIPTSVWNECRRDEYTYKEVPWPVLDQVCSGPVYTPIANGSSRQDCVNNGRTLAAPVVQCNTGYAPLGNECVQLNSCRLLGTFYGSSVCSNLDGGEAPAHQCDLAYPCEAIGTSALGVYSCSGGGLTSVITSGVSCPARVWFQTKPDSRTLYRHN